MSPAGGPVSVVTVIIFIIFVIPPRTLSFPLVLVFISPSVTFPSTIPTMFVMVRSPSSHALGSGSLFRTSLPISTLSLIFLPFNFLCSKRLCAKYSLVVIICALDYRTKETLIRTRGIWVRRSWKVCPNSNFAVAFGLLFGFPQDELCNMSVEVVVSDGWRNGCPHGRPDEV